MEDAQATGPLIRWLVHVGNLTVKNRGVESYSF